MLEELFTANLDCCSQENFENHTEDVVASQNFPEDKGRRDTRAEYIFSKQKRLGAILSSFDYRFRLHSLALTSILDPFLLAEYTFILSK